MAYAPTITVSTDANPCPRAEVAFTSLDPATASLRAMTRTAEEREWKVRGSVNIAVTDQVARLDYDVPFGVPVVWRGEMLNSGGDAIGFTDFSAPVTIDLAETWVHNPLNPQVALKVTLVDQSDYRWSRPVQGETVFPVGRRVGVVIGGARQGIRGMHLELWVDTEEDAVTFASLVGTYTRTAVPVLCFRIGTDVKMRIPRTFMGSVMDPRELGDEVAMGRTAVGFAFDTDEVAPPAAALVVPLLTRADLNAYYTTRAQLNADNATRFEVNRRYDLAGTAG